jgi:hypothetical protein
VKNRHSAPPAANGRTPLITDTQSMPHSAAAVKLPDDSVPIALLRVADLRALIRAEVSQPAPPANRLLTVDEISKIRPAVTRGWLKANVAPRGKGARQKPLYDLSEVDAATKADPPKLRAKSIHTKAAVNQDPFDALLASGAVIATKGAR